MVPAKKGYNFRSSKEVIREEYFDWLSNMVGVGNNSAKLKVTETMFNIEFIALVKGDNYRICDAMEMRSEYLNDRGIFIDIDNIGPCTVLEVLIALACRIELEYLGDPTDEDPDPTDIFWDIMVKNLGIKPNADTNFIEKIVVDWVYRRYDRHGNPGIFPLKNTRKDQRKLEIWTQACGYLTENFYDKYITF